MADDSLNQIISTWVNNNSWPRDAPENEKVILILKGVGENQFEFRSASHYFEVHATHDNDHSELRNLWVLLVVPGYHKHTTLAGSMSYSLMMDEPGDHLPINIGNGVITGSVSFQYVEKSKQKHVAMKYDVNLPFAGNLVDTIVLAPHELTPQAGFTEEQLEAIPLLVSSLELHSEQFKEESLSMVNGHYSASFAPNGEHDLLVKFLSDFSRDEDKVVIETYYPPDQLQLSLLGNSDAVSLAALGGSKQYTVSVSFLSIFDLEGSIDPKTLSASAGLFVRVPVAGRVRLTSIKGNLKSEAGITATINVIVAKGSVSLKVMKNSPKSKYRLYINLAADVKLVGKVKSGDLYLLTLPF